MAYQISRVESAQFLGKDADRYVSQFYSLVAPSDALLAELPLPKDLKTRPFSVPTNASRFLDAILDFSVRSDDVFVCSTPKCGSSWVQTIVWLLIHELDYETTSTVDSEQLVGTFNRTHGLENRPELFTDDGSERKKATYNEQYDKFTSPRVLKSFFPVYFLPKAIWSQANKVIYVVRNPKDMVVSEYHFLRNTFFMESSFTMDDIVNGVVNDAWSLSPRSDQVLNFWNVSKHLPNVHFVAYEDLVRDSFGSIKKISEFLGRKYTDQQLTQLNEYVSFDNMKRLKTINRENYVASIEKHTGKKRPDADFQFMRKGKVGSYRSDLNEEQIAKLDDWARNVEQESDFKFKI